MVDFPFVPDPEMARHERQMAIRFGHVPAVAAVEDCVHAAIENRDYQGVNYAELTEKEARMAYLEDMGLGIDQEYLLPRPGMRRELRLGIIFAASFVVLGALTLAYRLVHG